MLINLIATLATGVAASCGLLVLFLLFGGWILALGLAAAFSWLQGDRPESPMLPE
ncbi:hypothetical protein MAMC_01482 [Methylacidimicrobium cyclopophantes]|uniref:Uncharacterized protein n=1 Tax=Methylacidimicrobium cyclopophantes TaxID=1041766 RepID=A0A5E6MD98_9BACT|nr:hypothetical protein [Methylacidimicrobium cyclopophantes]VVM07180.1 hypothetical protein MAMC_01482 [Methylacidimicrobium cyclopophantes]